MSDLSRRELLLGAAAGATAAALPYSTLLAADPPGDRMQIGLVTYLWGKDWDLDTCLKNCGASQVLGIELRTQHRHGVEPSLNKQQRQDVKKKFADSPVVCLGPGSNERFDSPDAAQVQKAVENTKVLLQLSKDIGGSGVKVKPNSFQKSVPRERTIEQIGKSLQEVAKFADELGQEVRVEIHGSVGNDFEALRQIMEIADHPRAVLCWNSNEADVQGKGLEHNFNLVKDHFGQTVHVRELNVGNYPYQQLMDLLVKMDYAGWVLLECRKSVEEPVAAMIQQREVWQRMVATAQKKLAS